MPVAEQMKVLVPVPVSCPRGARVAGAAAAWLLRAIDRIAAALHPPSDLRALASSVEREQPALAAELRGIAMHWESFQRTERSRTALREAPSRP